MSLFDGACPTLTTCTRAHALTHTHRDLNLNAANPEKIDNGNVRLGVGNPHTPPPHTHRDLNLNAANPEKIDNRNVGIIYVRPKRKLILDKLN